LSDLSSVRPTPFNREADFEKGEQILGSAGTQHPVQNLTTEHLPTLDSPAATSPTFMTLQVLDASRMAESIARTVLTRHEGSQEQTVPQASANNVPEVGYMASGTVGVRDSETMELAGVIVDAIRHFQSRGEEAPPAYEPHPES
jgi:hypothetical protein